MKISVMPEAGAVLENYGNRAAVNQHSFFELIERLSAHYAGISYMVPVRWSFFGGERPGWEKSARY